MAFVDWTIAKVQQLLLTNCLRKAFGSKVNSFLVNLWDFMDIYEISVLKTTDNGKVKIFKKTLETRVDFVVISHWRESSFV